MTRSNRLRTALALAIIAALAVGLWLVTGVSRSTVRQASEPPKEEKRGPGGHQENEVITLTNEQRQALGLKIEPVQARVPEMQLTVTGKIAANPDRTVAITARTPGRVIRVQAQLGDTVEAGKTLALVDSVEIADPLADLVQSESLLSQAQARAEQERRLYDAKLRVLETARQQPSAEAALRQLASVELGRSKQEYISALAKFELAQAEYERQKLLVERKIGARKDLVRTEKELLLARSEVEAVAENIRLSARQELLAAETALIQAQAQRDRARHKLHLLGLTDSMIADAGKRSPGERVLVPLLAPFRGTVIERQVTEGQLLDTTSVPFRLADLSTVWALLDVSETEVPLIRVGQEAIIEAGRDGRGAFTGRVVYVGDVVEEQTRTVKVRVEIPNPRRDFKPGMFVTARIAARQSGPALLMLPKDAVVLLDEGPAVFVEGADGIRARQVEVGPEVEGWIPVRKGLKAGEKVVAAGAFALKAQIVKGKLGEE